MLTRLAGALLVCASCSICGHDRGQNYAHCERHHLMHQTLLKLHPSLWAKVIRALIKHVLGHLLPWHGLPEHEKDAAITAKRSPVACAGCITHTCVWLSIHIWRWHWVRRIQGRGCLGRKQQGGS